MDADVEAVLSAARDIVPSGGPGRAHLWLHENIDAVHALRARAYSWADIALLFYRERYADDAFRTPDGQPLAADTMRKKCERAGYRPDRLCGSPRSVAANGVATAPDTEVARRVHTASNGGAPAARAGSAGLVPSTTESEAGPRPEVAAGKPYPKQEQGQAHALDRQTQNVTGADIRPPTVAATGNKTAICDTVPHRKDDLLRKRTDRPSNGGGS